MAIPIHICGFLIFLLLITTANSDGSCNKGCPRSDNGLLKYTPGYFYEYTFDSILTVGLGSGVINEADDTSLKVTGSAKIFANGNCGYTLQVGAVKVINTKESVEKKIVSNIEKPVHFTMVSGHLESEICADASDSVYSLNIKRAIISLLQSETGTDVVNEIDVFGLCPTHTSTSKSSSIDVITKVRNLNNCARREQINGGLLSGIVNEKAGITSSSILQSDYSKELKVNRGVVEHVNLVESYKFTGTTKGNSDVTAKVLTTLKVKNAAGTPGNAPANGSPHATSIIFQKPETYPAKNIAALKSTLSELVDETSDYVKKDTAKKFVELIRLLRHSDTDTLLELAAAPHPNKALSRKVYLDALFRTNTAESARAILKQINKFEEKEKLLAILSLSLVESVDKETLNLASGELLPTAPKEIYLAVGSLVTKYCSRNGCHVSDIEPISKKFADGLKHCKPNTKKEEERIVYILKGIGNAQNLAKNVATALSECASPGRSNRIRVAALQAFSTIGCDGSLNARAVELLKNHNEDSELRIEAYLAAINCPTAELANQISEIVSSEKVYQVGGFIESHLKAIRDSTDATREQQRYHLANIRVTKRFPKDYRRYSFNNEFSYKLDALGLSASSDYKLIYSQHGFLPRSARLNVTTEIFGTNFNVFEASIRQENLENLLEYYVGPKGLLNKDFDEIVKIIEAGNNGGNKAGGRARRSIANDAAKTAKKYKTYGSKNAQDLNLDLSLKLFGSELAFLSLGDNIPTTLDDIIKHFSDAFDKAKKELSSFEKQFTSHNLFLDSDFTYPTGIGVPLEFTAQGFVVNKISFGINVDVNAILEQNWQRAKYRLKFVPSIDVNVNVQLGFNTQVLSTGLRVVSNGHSATGSDVSVSLINNGDGFNVDVELPRDKLELIDVQVNSEFYVAEQDKPVKSVPLKAGKKQKSTVPSEMCFNQLDMVGFNICMVSSTSLSDIGTNTNKGSSLVDNIHLSRPFNFAVYLETERKFNFKGTHSTMQSGSQQWKLACSTPGSKVSHDTSVAFELGTAPRTYGRLTLDNPHYHLGVEGGINNDNHELVLYGQYEQDKIIKKSKIGFTKNGNEYTPVIEIQDKNGVTNDINGYQVDGKIVVQKTGDKQARYNFQNVQIFSRNNDRIVLQGWVDLGPTAFNAELHIAPNQQQYLVKSNIQLGNGHYAIGLFMNDEEKPENVYGSSADLSINNNAYALKLTAKAAAWEINSASELDHVKSKSSKGLHSGKVTQDLVVKHKNKLVGSVNAKSTFDLNKFQLVAEAAGDQKSASLNVNYQSNQRSVHDYELEIKANLNKHSIDIVSKCDANGNLFNIDNTLTTSWGTSLTAKGELGQRFTAQDVHIDLQGNAQFSNKEKPTQWVLKVLGTPEKTNTDIRINQDNAELIKLTSESQHPQDNISAAKVNLIVKNVLTAKGDFKISKNGKGDLTATIETQKTEPKHKLEIVSKFHVQAPKFDIDTNIVLDSDKKIHLKTENIADKLKFSTKNILEANDKKIAFDASGNVKGDWRLNGDIVGTFKLTTTDGRIVDGSLNRHVTTNARTHITQGTADVEINHQEPVTGKKQSLVFNGKLDRMNVKSKEISVNSQIVYTAMNGETLEVKYNIQHLLKGQNKGLDVSLLTKGSLLDQTVDISLVIDEYSESHVNGRFSGKYGEKLLVRINGKYDLGQINVPATFNLQGNLQIAESNFKSWDITSNGKLLKTTDSTGTYNIELFMDTKSGDNQFARLKTVCKGTSKQGSYSFDLHNNNMVAPLKFDGSYQNVQAGSIKDSDMSGMKKFDINTQLGDKYIKTGAVLTYGNADGPTLQYTLDSSYEAAKDIEVTIRNNKPAEGTQLISVHAKQADKSYSLDTKLYSTTHKKGLDVRAALPGNQPIVLVAIVEVLGERKAKLTLDMDNLFDLDFKSSAEASYTNIDHFYIVADWNSKKLHLYSYVLDIKAEGKNVKATLQNAKTTVFSGTAIYNLKKEQTKSIIEAQGQVQYQGKTHNSNFKLIRQHFDLNTEKEVGFSYTFNGNFGPMNGVSTIKITNQEFNSKISICEDKKQCTNIQLQSTVTVDEQHLDSVQHDVLVLIDLRELGYPYELEIKSKNIRQGLKYTYNLDSHIISSNNLKYQLTANVLPTASTIKLTLPKRQILFESVQRVPTDGVVFGHYEQSAVFYIDKLQRPNDVARISAVLDISGVDKDALNVKGHLNVEHPTIRPLSVSGYIDANRDQRVINSEVVFDIFRSVDQKVIVTNLLRNTQAHSGFNISSNQQIRSAGLRFQYELNTQLSLNTDTREFTAVAELQSSTSDLKAGANIFGNNDRVEISVNALNEQIIHVTGDFDKQKRSAKINTKLQIFGHKPVELVSEIHPTWAKVSVKRQNLIDANVELKLGKEFKFDVVGTGKPIFNGRVALDASNFLQTTYKTSDEDVKVFLTSVETEFNKETVAITASLKKRFENVRHNFEENYKLASKSSPGFTKLRNGYEDQLKTIVKELESDPSLAHIIEAVQTLFEKISKVIDEVTKTTSENYEKLHKTFVELYEKLKDLWENSLLKALEQLMVAINKVVGQLRVEIVNIYTKAFKDVIAWIEKYGPAMKNYGKAISEALKPLQEAAQELIKVAVHTAEEVCKEIKEYFAKFPTFESIRTEITNKIHDLKLVEKTIELLNNVFEQLHIIPQTPETNELLHKLHEYLNAKLKQQPINDGKVIDELSKLLLMAVRSALAAIKANAPVGSVPASDLESWLSSWPSSVESLTNLPTLLSFRTSVINFLLNENWDGIISKHLFSSWVFFKDFELHGHIVDGQHVFSFDGLNYAFPGNCKYILAQDSVDNNFTVIAQLNNGKLKGIAMVDRDGNYMEVSDAAALKVNGKPVEYPQHLPGIHAWRLFYTVHLHSEYGVSVMCTTDLKVCHVNVNGFYVSKTRGLLGNGNAEPYDDYLLIDGTLANNAADLGNDYGLGKCAPVEFDQSQPESPKRNDICSEIFGIESPLALNYFTLDSRPYRTACDIAVSSVPEKDKESVACTFALAYGSALKIQHKWVLLPPRCLKCAAPVGQLGEEFTVKIPTNKADVVFVVDINTTPNVLANLVALTITEIRESLKLRGFTDVQVGVIAFDETKRYPALLTSDNGKINYKANVANIQLNGPKYFCENCVEQIITEKRVLDIYKLVERFVKTIVPQSDEKAFNLALDYPFRAGAAKSIVGVRSDSLENNNWWKLMRAQITGAVTKFDGAQLHLIAPIKGLALEGVPTEKLVGFNARLVATLDGKDNKKRAKLEFDNDMGIDFVLNNGGWAFDTKHFDKLKVGDQKKVLNQVTSSIADTLFKTEIVSDCRCLPVHGLHGQNKCSIKSSSFVPNKKPKVA